MNGNTLEWRAGEARCSIDWGETEAPWLQQNQHFGRPEGMRTPAVTHERARHTTDEQCTLIAEVPLREWFKIGNICIILSNTQTEEGWGLCSGRTGLQLARSIAAHSPVSKDCKTLRRLKGETGFTLSYTYSDGLYE